MTVKNVEGKSREGLYIALFSVHGLIRGDRFELGRDADTGGQVKYVVELAKALSQHPTVSRVDLITRQIHDPKVDPIYSEPDESIAPKAYIVRMQCGPRRYLRKEVLWPYMDQFADRVLQHFRRVGLPDVLHAHYADAGYVGAKLSNLLGIPLVFTGHSLGRVKRERLLDKGLSDDRIVQRYNINDRIEAEENALNAASIVVASTHQEVEEQYQVYENYQPQNKVVIPPGTDLKRFSPPRRPIYEYPIFKEIDRFLSNPRKPIVLAISRADERKNIATLVRAYAEHKELRRIANLVIVAGNRDDIQTLDSGARDVLRDLLLAIDKYDLYGSIAYPKHHEPDDVPDLYRIAARTRGVFVNPALTEPFGLTLIEAAACGIPIVATNDGGPTDIIGNCQNGLLIDPLDAAAMGRAIHDVIQDNARWIQYSRNGLRGVKRFYSWDSHVKTYLKSIKRFMKKKPRPFWIHSGKKLLQADRILITDVDNTLLGQPGDVGDPEALKELIGRMHDSPHRIGFGIATGRRLDSAIRILEKFKVPRPDVLISSVGSEIHYGNDLREDSGWKKHIHYKWEPKRLRECMKDFPGFLLQPDEDQREHKLSYFVDTANAPSKREIVRFIRNNNFKVKIIYSHQQYLDFLPIRASKGLAIWYLANRWGIPMDHLLVAGDSGNDEEMLTGQVLGVVVGNYSPELEPLRNRQNVYFAEGQYARGVLEGMDYYNFWDEIKIPENQAA